jgi:hypothetical protein
MVEKHYEKLRQTGDPGNRYIGNNSLRWARAVLADIGRLDDSKGLDKRFQRYDLLDYCREPTHGHLDVLVAILSWGGMRRNHGRQLLAHYEALVPLVEKLRAGGYGSRLEAFEALRRHRQSGRSPGLGVGYYTKLICFLAHDHNGYIMDQWVGRSVNLLIGRPVVRFTGPWVNDQNTGADYEAFCCIIDELGNKFGCSGFEAEKRLFSYGGRNPGAWRRYLMEHT